MPSPMKNPYRRFKFPARPGLQLPLTQMIRRRAPLAHRSSPIPPLRSVSDDAQGLIRKVMPGRARRGGEGRFLDRRRWHIPPAVAG